MGDVIAFTGETYLDVDPDNMMRSVMGKLERLLIVAETKEGKTYLATSTSDLGSIILDLEAAKADFIEDYRSRRNG